MTNGGAPSDLILGSDTIVLEHMDGDGNLRIRESCPVGFLSTSPLRNDPEASVIADQYPVPDLTPWYRKDGG